MWNIYQELLDEMKQHEKKYVLNNIQLVEIIHQINCYLSTPSIQSPLSPLQQQPEASQHLLFHPLSQPEASLSLSMAEGSLHLGSSGWEPRIFLSWAHTNLSRQTSPPTSPNLPWKTCPPQIWVFF